MRKLNMSHVYTAVRMFEAMRASLDIYPLHIPRGIPDPYRKFLLYFTKHGEVGPPDLSFGTLRKLFCKVKQFTHLGVESVS